MVRDSDKRERKRRKGKTEGRGGTTEGREGGRGPLI